MSDLKCNIKELRSRKEEKREWRDERGERKEQKEERISVRCKRQEVKYRMLCMVIVFYCWLSGPAGSPPSPPFRFQASCYINAKWFSKDFPMNFKCFLWCSNVFRCFPMPFQWFSLTFFVFLCWFCVLFFAFLCFYCLFYVFLIF